MKRLTGHKQKLSNNHKMMIFFLSMILFGFSDMLTEFIPKFHMGSLKIGVPYFSFVSLIACILLNPVYAALGACTGEIVFGDVLLGNFSGIGEFERFIEYFIGMAVAGLLVRNPKNKANLAMASLAGVGLDRLMSCSVDIVKLYLAMGRGGGSAGLAAGAVPLEIVSNILDILISGILLGVLPVWALVPRLYGKLEPLLGLEPRFLPEIGREPGIGPVHMEKEAVMAAGKETTRRTGKAPGSETEKRTGKEPGSDIEKRTGKDARKDEGGGAT